MQESAFSNTDLIVDSMRVGELLAGVVDRRGKTARLLEKGVLVPLRRGLYLTRRDADPLCAAAAIYGPSYVSFETALAWHGMIPEAVVEVISATLKRPALFENPLGRFRYLQVPLQAYSIGIMREMSMAVPFLVASPTKALCDTIALQAGMRSLVDVNRWLEMMRIDVPSALDGDELRNSARFYGRPAVRWLERFAEKNHLIGS